MLAIDPVDALLRKRRLPTHFSWTAGPRRTERDTFDHAELEQAIQYWGLLKHPFGPSKTSPDGSISAADWTSFYHAGPTRQQATAWLQTQLRRKADSENVLTVFARPGVGWTAWVQQLIGSTGIDQQPFQSVGLDARLVSPEKVLRHVESRMPNDLPLAVFVDRAMPLQIDRLRSAVREVSSITAGQSLTLWLCATRSKPTQADFHFPCPSNEELARAACMALEQSSGGHGRISRDVGKPLAKRAANRYDRLAELTRRLLIEGRRLGKHRLTSRDIAECLGETLPARSVCKAATARAA